MLLRACLFATALSLSAGSAALAQTGLDALSASPGGRTAAAVATPGTTVPASGVAPAVNPDPFEPFNRKSYALFVFLDRHFIRPAAVFYAHAVPKVARTGLHNAIQNVGEPVIFFNDVVQLHPKAAAQTFGRLAINSTVGVAGLGDPATGAGIPYHQNGFGTTLGRYGVPAGPYLFIPVLGPSDVRDALGGGVDSLSDPLTWIRFTGRWQLGVAKTVIGGLDTRANGDAQLRQIYSMATDPYATIRSLYLQNRRAQINGGQVDINNLPDFGPASGAPDEAGKPGQAPAEIGPAGAASALPDQSAPTTAQPTPSETAPAGPAQSEPAPSEPAPSPPPQPQ